MSFFFSSFFSSCRGCTLFIHLTFFFFPPKNLSPTPTLSPTSLRHHFRPRGRGQQEVQARGRRAHARRVCRRRLQPAGRSDGRDGQEGAAARRVRAGVLRLRGRRAGLHLPRRGHAQLGQGLCAVRVEPDEKFQERREGAAAHCRVVQDDLNFDFVVAFLSAFFLFVFFCVVEKRARGRERTERES